jgi:hypothetical protein
MKLVTELPDIYYTLAFPSDCKLGFGEKETQKSIQK